MDAEGSYDFQLVTVIDAQRVVVAAWGLSHTSPVS